jgi:hypothetical protein
MRSWPLALIVVAAFTGGAFAQEDKKTDDLSDRLGARADREALRHRAEAETSDLGKDEPHPMCPLSSARQFLGDLPIDRRLSIH